MFLVRCCRFHFFFVALVALATAGTGRCFTLFVDSSREDLVLRTGYFFFEFWRVVTMVRLGESKNRKPLFSNYFMWCGFSKIRPLRVELHAARSFRDREIGCNLRVSTRDRESRDVGKSLASLIHHQSRAQ